MWNVLFLTIVTVANGQERSVLTACVLAERGTNRLFYNYDRSAAAVDLAVQYANEAILADRNLVLQKHYVDIGSACSAKSRIGQFVMDLVQKGVNCDVYIGPGTLNIYCTMLQKKYQQLLFHP